MTNLRGVPNTLVSPKSMRSSPNLARNASRSCSRAGMMSLGGRSSVPTSRSNTFPLRWLLLFEFLGIDGTGGSGYSLRQVSLRTSPGQGSASCDEGCAFGGSKGTTSLKKIKQMRTLEKVFVCRHDPTTLQLSQGLLFKAVKCLLEKLCVCRFKAEFGLFTVMRATNINILHSVAPIEVEDARYSLNVHRDPFKPIREFY